MSIRIVTDSGADLEALEYEQYGIGLIPLGLTVDQQTYAVTGEFSKQDFFRMLETAEVFPSTSQPAPADLEKAFAQAKEAGDELIYITLSSALSGTFQTAALVKNLGDFDNVYLVDSLSATLGQKILVLEAAKLRDQGLSAREIAGALDAIKGRVRIFAGIETLEYLYKGGRLSRASASLGNLARIKPIITVTQEGQVSMAGKGMGVGKAISVILSRLEKHPPDQNYPIMGIYSGNQDNLSALREKAKAQLELEISDDMCFCLGPVIGAHIGAGAYGFIYIEKE